MEMVVFFLKDNDKYDVICLSQYYSIRVSVTVFDFVSSEGDATFCVSKPISVLSEG